MKQLSTIFLFIGILSLNSCVKELVDMTKIKGGKITNLNGTYAVPLVNDSITLKTLIQDHDKHNVIRENSSGYLSAVYDTLAYTLDVNQFIVIPPFNQTVSYPVNPAASAPFALIPNDNTYSLTTAEPISKSLTFGTYELDNMSFLNGDIVVTFPNINQKVDYIIEIPLLKNSSGVALKITKTVAENTTVSETVNLANYTWDFTGGTAGNFNQLNLLLSTTITKKSSTLPTSLDLGVELKNISYNRIQGYFGNSNFSPITTSLPIDIFNDNTSGGTFEVVSPIIKLYIQNDFQLPFQLSLNNNLFVVKNKGADINLSGITLPTIQGATSPTTPTNDSSILTNNISPNIGTIVAANPNLINFTINTQLNPAGKTSIRNVIRYTDKIKVRSSFELPLNVNASNFILNKDFEFPISKIDYADSVLNKVAIKINLTNAFPFETIVQVQIIDPTSGLVLKNLFPANNYLLKAGTTSAPANAISEIEVSGMEWNQWAALGVKKIRLVNQFSTTGGGATYQQLQSSQYIKAQIGAKLFFTGKL